MAPPSNFVDKFGTQYNKVQYELTTSGISLYASASNKSDVQQGYFSERKDDHFMLLPGDVFHAQRKEKGTKELVTSPPIHFLGAVLWRFKTGRREIKWIVDLDGVPKVVVPRAAGFGNTNGIIVTRKIIGSPSSAENRASAFERAASFRASEDFEQSLTKSGWSLLQPVNYAPPVPPAAAAAAVPAAAPAVPAAADPIPAPIPVIVDDEVSKY